MPGISVSVVAVAYDDILHVHYCFCQFIRQWADKPGDPSYCGGCANIQVVGETLSEGKYANGDRVGDMRMGSWKMVWGTLFLECWELRSYGEIMQGKKITAFRLFVYGWLFCCLLPWLL